MKPWLLVLMAALLVAWPMGTASAQALDPIGGPYTVDSATVLLLHFDGNMQNAAAAEGKTADSATIHTTNPAKVYYIPNSGVAGMGQCVRLDNSAVNDSTYLTVADTAALDMTGNWTIEAWANIFTFGATSNDYRWVPRVVMKPGEDVFWHPNYWLEMWGDNRLFHAGYYTPGDAFISLTSENNMFTPGQWVHLTFIRDTTRNIVVQMVHDANKNLLSFSTRAFTDADVPRPNNNPLHIGWAGALGIADPSVDSWLDGFVDEIRISNSVRNFAGPPVVTSVTQLPNQPTTATGYTINADAQPFNAGGSITSVTLHYTTNGTTWDSLQMTGSGTYSATIGAQPFGTTIKYYVSAIDNNGLRSLVPINAEAATNPGYYSFAIYEPNVQTLWLTFEEGPGNRPVDHSPSPKPIVPFRIPDYSTDAKQGTYSLLLQNFSTPTSIDSNWVEVQSPFLAAEEFTIDMWLNADSSLHATRILNLPRQPDDWNNNNYEISLRNNTKGVGITGRYFAPVRNALIVTQDSNAIVLGKWYHVIYERAKANNTVALMVRNENDSLLFFTSKVDSAPVMGGSVAPANLRVGRAHTDATNWWYIPPFRGKLDNIQIYNYPKTGITAIEAPPEEGLPWVFELSQNYPNPFNPTTRIQFTIPQFQRVALVVYDLLGRQVKTLVDEEKHAGTHWATWNGTNDHGLPVASGVYFYRLTAGDNMKVQKMMLLR